MEIATICGVLEWDFWRMQPWYLNELAAVHAKRRELDRELAAWVTSNIMRALVGEKAPSVDELLGRVVDA